MTPENTPDRPPRLRSGAYDASATKKRSNEGEPTTEYQVLGSGDRVVVLDAGFRDPWTAWAPVTASLGDIALLVVVDRANAAGVPDPGGDACSDSITDQIEALAGLRPLSAPPIVVAWALGTILAPSFASSLSSPASGLVLIDPVPPLLVREIEARFDEIARAGSPYSSDLIDEIARAREHLGLDALLSADPVDLPSTPRIHILRGEHPSPDDTLGGLWVDLQQRHRDHMSNVREVIAGRSGQNIPRDRPDVVVDAVRDLLYRNSG